jgi:hypothetical protein
VSRVLRYNSTASLSRDSYFDNRHATRISKLLSSVVLDVDVFPKYSSAFRGIVGIYRGLAMYRTPIYPTYVRGAAKLDIILVAFK